MNNVMTIGVLAKKTGIPAKNIRFYEEIGLIDPPKRAENGYRTYRVESIDKLKVIKYARDLGLPIEEIKRLMNGCPEGNCKHSEKFLENEINSYLLLLDGKIGQLSALKEQLRLMKKNLDKYSSGSKYCCNILGQLSETWKGGEAK